MKLNLFPKKAVITSESAYLSALGKRLTWYFPAPQVTEILADYQEYLSNDHEQGATMETIVARWGSPKSVTERLLEECPEGKLRFCRHLALWLCVLLIATYFYFYVSYGSYLFLVISSISLFEFFHLGRLAANEHKFSVKSKHTRDENGKNDNSAKSPAPTRTIPWLLLIVHCALPSFVLLAESLAQYVVTYVDSLPSHVGSLQIGLAVGYVSALFQVLALLLFIWMLLKSLRTSVHYFPAVIHALGAFLFIVETRNIFTSMDLSATEEALTDIFTQCLVVYILGVALAVFAQMLLSLYGAKEDLSTPACSLDNIPDNSSANDSENKLESK